MGHYRSEMMCEKCGEVRCTCPSKPRTDLGLWFIDEDGVTPITVEEYEKKYAVCITPWGNIPSVKRMFHLRLPKFKTRQEALESL